MSGAEANVSPALSIVGCQAKSFGAALAESSVKSKVCLFDVEDTRNTTALI